MKHLTKKRGYFFIVSAFVLCCFFSCKSNNSAESSNVKDTSANVLKNVDTVNNAYERKEIKQIDSDEVKAAKK